MKRALNHVLDIWMMTAAMLLVVIVIGAACAGNNDDALLADYAECLFDKGLARDATAADTLARLQSDRCGWPGIRWSGFGLATICCALNEKGRLACISN